MASIGLFYGTDTGNTEQVAEKIKSLIQEIKPDIQVDLIEIYQRKATDMAQYDFLIIGQPTWYDGELQGDWEEFIPEFEAIDFTGKQLAFFGLGDQYGYAAYFCDAIGVYADMAENQGGTLHGFTSATDYEHDFSKAQRGDQFVGLCLDIDNQDDLTDERINQWIPKVLASFGM